MVLDEVHFEYGDFISRTYDLVFAHVDTSVFTPSAGTLASHTLFNKRENTRYVVKDDYSGSPISATVEIITCSGNPIQKQHRRVVEKALFNRREYVKLYIDITDDIMGDTYEFIDGIQKRLYFNCRLLNPERIETGNGLVAGYRCTMECDCGFLTQDTISKTFSISSPQTIVVETNDDTKDYIYPKVTIQIGSSGGDITIRNITDDNARYTSFTGLTANTQLVLDGRINYVSGQNYSKFAYQNFIRLLDGDNSIAVTGNVTSIKFEWNNRRFL